MSVELSVVLASGDIANIVATSGISKAGSPVVSDSDLNDGTAIINGSNLQEAGSEVITEANLEGRIATAAILGTPVVSVADAATAALNRIYWNIATQQIEYKDPNGVVKKFQLQNP